MYGSRDILYITATGACGQNARLRVIPLDFRFCVDFIDFFRRLSCRPQLIFCGHYLYSFCVF